VPFSLPSFFWASKRKKGAAAHSPLSNRVRADARIKIHYRGVIHNPRAKENPAGAGFSLEV
jgi:hypothetical protein